MAKVCPHDSGVQGFLHWARDNLCIALAEFHRLISDEQARLRLAFNFNSSFHRQLLLIYSELTQQISAFEIEMSNLPFMTTSGDPQNDTLEKILARHEIRK